MSVSSPTDSNVKAYFETEYGTLFRLVRLDNAVNLVVVLGHDDPSKVTGATVVVGEWFTRPEIESLKCNFTILLRDDLGESAEEHMRKELENG